MAPAATRAALPGDPHLPDWGPAQMAELRRELADPVGDAFDLVVVGAGITGAGVARDAAMRGLSVLVLEAKDVAFGTSSRSTRLIHGGVRYLEQGQIGLVYEALRERARLYEAAPHLVRPARFLFPAYDGDRLAPWKLRVGLGLYDLLSMYRARAHNYLRPAAARDVEPTLAQAGLRGAVQYEDAVTDDARLTVTTLQSAIRHGARVLTYAPVEGIEHVPEDREGPYRVAVRDGSTVRARTVVLATGPWTGARLLGQPGQSLIAKSKGIHLVVRWEDAPVKQPVVVQVRGERRILFVVPWGSRTYLGTTDTSYSGDPGQSGVSEDDEAQVLELCGRVLNGARLSPDRIVSAWSGVRPLVRSGRPKRGGTEELARTHRVVENQDGVFALVGGKLTTYRAMAEEMVDKVVERLRRDGRPREVAPCSTHRVPLVEAAPLSPEELADPLVADLAERHGPTARRMRERVAADPRLGDRLVPDLPYRQVEIDWAVQHEGCTHLDDLLRRRLPLALTDLRLGGGVAREVATALVRAREQAGESGSVQAELERFADLVRVETRRRPDFGPTPATATAS